MFAVCAFVAVFAFGAVFADIAVFAVFAVFAVVAVFAVFAVFAVIAVVAGFAEVAVEAVVAIVAITAIPTSFVCFVHLFPIIKLGCKGFTNSVYGFIWSVLKAFIRLKYLCCHCLYLILISLKDHLKVLSYLT